MTGLTGWGLAAGDELVPGRVVHHLLGGGGSYEAYLVFDDGLLHAAGDQLVPGRQAPAGQPGHPRPEFEPDRSSLVSS